MIGSTVIIIILSLACCPLLLCIICLLVAICRRKAARMGQENISLEQGQIGNKNWSNNSPLPESPHSYVNIDFEGEASLGNLPLQHLSGVSRTWHEIPRKMIWFQNHLGVGSFSEIMKGFIVKNDASLTCAIKMLKECSTKVELRKLENELNVMSKIGDNPNISSLIGACTLEGPLWLIFKFAENGSLLEYLHLHRTNKEQVDSLSTEIDLPNGEKLRLAEGIAKGMRHIASIKCVHRDLACRNVLLAKGNIPKISNFGLSREIVESDHYAYTEELPTRWMAVESLLDYSFTEKTDVWSFGVALWEIESAGRVPFPDMTEMEILEELLSGYRLKKPTGSSDEIYEIMSECWQTDPAKRPTFEELVAMLSKLISGLSSEEISNLNEDDVCEDEQDDKIKEFFVNSSETLLKNTEDEKQHTYVNVDVERETLLTTNKRPDSRYILRRKRYRSRSLERVRFISNITENMNKCGSLDRLINIYNLPDKPPALPSYDKLLSLHYSPRTIPKLSLYDRLLNISDSASSSRRSSITKDGDLGFGREEVKKRQEGYDRLQRWVDNVPVSCSKETHNKWCSMKIFTSLSTEDKVNLQKRYSCYMFPDVFKEEVNHRKHSKEISSTWVKDPNDIAKYDGDQLFLKEARALEDNDEHKIENNRGVRTSSNEVTNDEDSMYFEIKTSGFDSLEFSRLNGQYLTQDASFQDTNEELYSHIRDSGIVCDDNYCEIEICPTRSASFPDDEAQESNGIYDTIDNYLELYGFLDYVDENKQWNAYSTINIYDSPCEIQEIHVDLDETKTEVANTIISDVDLTYTSNRNDNGTEGGELEQKSKIPLELKCVEALCQEVDELQ